MLNINLLPKYVLGTSSKLLLLFSGAAIFFILFFSSAFAEGSKELNPSGGHRVSLYSSTTSTTGIPYANQGLVRVYVQQDETIYVGSSVQG